MANIRILKKKKSQTLPGASQWVSSEVYYSPAEGPLSFAGQKTPECTDVCQSLEGENAQCVSSVRGKNIILGADAFKKSVQRSIPTEEKRLVLHWKL